MRLTVNGQALEAQATTLAALLEELELPARRCATALNSEFVPRGQREATPLKDGDRIEILTPMQGG